jgi:cell division inhibitor SepF
MSLLDMFSKSERRRVTENTHVINAENTHGINFSQSTQNGVPVQIRRPKSFEDIEEIIDSLKQNKTVIVYLNEINPDTLTRVLDILSGAIYALSGGMAELEKEMYVFTPSGVNKKN